MEFIYGNLEGQCKFLKRMNSRIRFITDKNDVIRRAVLTLNCVRFDKNNEVINEVCEIPVSDDVMQSLLLFLPDFDKNKEIIHQEPEIELERKKEIEQKILLAMNLAYIYVFNEFVLLTRKEIYEILFILDEEITYKECKDTLNFMFSVKKSLFKNGKNNNGENLYEVSAQGAKQFRKIFGIQRLCLKQLSLFEMRLLLRIRENSDQLGCNCNFFKDRFCEKCLENLIDMKLCVKVIECSDYIKLTELGNAIAIIVKQLCQVKTDISNI